MPTINVFAGQLAEKFGRSASIGQNLMKEFQAQGLFPKGAGGGFGGSPDAGSAHAVALFLALAVDRGTKASVEAAVRTWRYPGLPSFLSLVAPAEGKSEGEFKGEQIRDGSRGFGNFGNHLARLVAATRLGLLPNVGSDIQCVAFGPSLAEIGEGNRRPAMRALVRARIAAPGGGLAQEDWEYMAPAENVPTLAPFQIPTMQYFGGGIVAELAAMLGEPDSVYGLPVDVLSVANGGSVGISDLDAASFLPNLHRLTDEGRLWANIRADAEAERGE